MQEIFMQKLLNGTQGISVWCGTKVQGTTQKMTGSIREKKLLRGSASTSAQQTLWQLMKSH